MVCRMAVLVIALVGCTPIHEGDADVAPPMAEATAPVASRTITIPTATDERFVVHEWGTFTAVANAEGSLLPWRPLLGASDLPSFVYTQAEDVDALRRANKGHLAAAIRMETPVLYFYSATPRAVDVRVGFVGGTITEWYPAADKTAGELHSDLVDWGRIELSCPA